MFSIIWWFSCVRRTSLSSSAPWRCLFRTSTPSWSVWWTLWSPTRTVSPTSPSLPASSSQSPSQSRDTSPSAPPWHIRPGWWRRDRRKFCVPTWCQAWSWQLFSIFPRWSALLSFYSHRSSTLQHSPAVNSTSIHRDVRGNIFRKIWLVWSSTSRLTFSTKFSIPSSPAASFPWSLSLY